MSAILNGIHKINPQALWLHFPHSEGGLITHNSIQGMTPTDKALLKEHLCIHALGPARPLPLDFGFSVVNVYSGSDRVTMRFAEHLMNDPNYDIRVVPCLTNLEELSWFEHHFIGDHAFQGNTYQKSLHQAIDEFKGDYGFYETPAP